MLYRIFIRPLILRLHPEIVRKWARLSLRLLTHLPLTGSLVRFSRKKESAGHERELFGIRFTNPVGLAPGIERTGENVDEWARIGFSFIETGPLTPLPQDAAESSRRGRRIRTVRGKESRDINQGVLDAISFLSRRKAGTIVAGNLLYGRDADEQQAVADLSRSFSLLQDFVDFFVIPVARPGKPASDVSIPYLNAAVDPLLDNRMGLDIIKAVVLKLGAPVAPEDLDALLDYALRSGVDGLVVPASQVREAVEKSRGLIPIIASGARTASHAAQLIAQGASLVEAGSALAYEGFSVVRKILKLL